MGQQIADAPIDMARQFFQVKHDVAAQVGDLLRQDDAEFGNQAAQPVVDGRPLLDEASAGAMQAEDDLMKPLRSGLSSQKTRAKPLRMLVFFLDRDEAHVRPPHGFADRGGVRGVVLAALAGQAVGADELRRHQLDGMAMLAELPRPVVRAGAGFHADQARRQLDDQLQQFVARNFRLDQHGLAVIINAMHGKNVLGQIDANGDNAHGLPLSWF